MNTIKLISLALTLLTLVASIITKQRRAKSCPAHIRLAGQLATILAILSAIAVACLRVAAASMRNTE